MDVVVWRSDDGVYVLPWCMYCRGVCTAVVYALPWRMHYRGVCTAVRLPPLRLGCGLCIDDISS